jgi:hypothetical protein
MVKKFEKLRGKGILLPLLVILWALLYQGSCGDGPTKFDAKRSNQPPETRITSKTLKKVDLGTDSLGAVTNLNQFSFSVEYTGSDQDGSVDSFAVRVDGGAFGDWTTRTSFSGTVDFASENDVHTVEVTSMDNEGTEDPTPAAATLSLGEILANKAPITSIVSGPADGSTTGGGVTFGISGSDENGNVVEFAYTVDGGAETIIAADSEGKASVEFSVVQGNVLAEGNHVFAAQSVDNFGVRDETPDTRSFFVGSGFSAIIQQSTGPTDGGGWFAGAAAVFTWRGETEYYTGAVSNYSYALDDETLNADGSYAFSGSAWLPYTDPVSASIDIPAGEHTVFLALRDAGGTVTIQSNRVSVALPTFDQGILLVNGVIWSSYDPLIQDGFEAKAYFGDLTVGAFWDLHPGIHVPTTVPASSGSGPVPPDVLAKYSSVVWLGNNFQGDLPDWEGTPILAYLQAGGNVILATRNGANFFDDALTSYANISGREGFTSGTVRIREYVPVFPGLVKMTPFTRSMSATAVFSGGGGFLNSSDDGTVTDWDGASSYTKSTFTHTMLFAHRSSATTMEEGGTSPFSFVRGLSVWAHPNLVYTERNETTLPTPGTDETKSNFVYIAGRIYGQNYAGAAHNFEYILRNFFGEM